jgi:fructose-1,6-bisphosphatase I
LVAAGYCLYSATTVLVLTLGSGVDGCVFFLFLGNCFMPSVVLITSLLYGSFTLDPDTGRFLHTHKDIRIPDSGSIYSFNEANFRDFEEPVKRYLVALKEGSSSVHKRYVIDEIKIMKSEVARLTTSLRLRTQVKRTIHRSSCC